MLDMNHLLSMQINSVLNGNQNNNLPLNINSNINTNANSIPLQGNSNSNFNQNLSYMFKQTNSDNINSSSSSIIPQAIGQQQFNNQQFANNNTVSNGVNTSQNMNNSFTNDFIMNQLNKLSSQVENLTTQLESKQKIIDEMTKQGKQNETKQNRIISQSDKMLTLKPSFSNSNLRK